MKKISRHHPEGPHDFVVIARRVVETATGAEVGWKTAQHGRFSQLCRAAAHARIIIRPGLAEESVSDITALTTAARVQVVQAVINRHSLRSAVRLTGVPQNQIKALIMKLGPVCTQYQDEVLQQLPAAELQCSETLAFRAKAGNTPEEQEYRRTTGSVWTWTCMDARTRLVPTWRIGSKNSNAEAELREDFAHRYRQSKPIGASSVAVGSPSPDLRGREHLGHVCPAWFATLKAGFARKVERHAAALALYLMYYNFSLIHQDLGTTPAIAAGKAASVWRVEDIVALLDRPISYSL